MPAGPSAADRFTLVNIDAFAGRSTLLDTLRHSFGTHAALFGVNPWRLQAWLGHKRIDETMLYVHVAENHRREIPAEILAAASGESAPDRVCGKSPETAGIERGAAGLVKQA